MAYQEAVLKKAWSLEQRQSAGNHTHGLHLTAVPVHSVWLAMPPGVLPWLLSHRSINGAPGRCWHRRALSIRVTSFNSKIRPLQKGNFSNSPQAPYGYSSDTGASDLALLASCPSGEPLRAMPLVEGFHKNTTRRPITCPERTEGVDTWAGRGSTEETGVCGLVLNSRPQGRTELFHSSLSRNRVSG